jgi:hypothetical protein
MAICQHCHRKIQFVFDRWLEYYPALFPQYCPNPGMEGQFHEPIPDEKIIAYYDGWMVYTINAYPYATGTWIPSKCVPALPIAICNW